MTKRTIGLTLLILSCSLILSYGQTNLTVGENGLFSGSITNNGDVTTYKDGKIVSQADLEPMTVHNASEALGAFIHYQFPKISAEQGIELAGGLMAIVLCGARYARKLIPDSWQVNKLGLALAHVAGEVNPTIVKLAEAAAVPSQTPAGSPNPVPTLPVKI